jgi:hypothetical protein
MELKEQLSIVKDELAKALIIAFETKKYGTAKQLFEAFDIINSQYIPSSVNTNSSFSITSNPDIISFGGTDSGICLG